MEVTSSIQRSPGDIEFAWNFLFNAAITKLSKHYTLYMVIYLRTEELNIYTSLKKKLFGYSYGFVMCAVLRCVHFNIL
jgi:hypothetical protein